MQFITRVFVTVLAVILLPGLMAIAQSSQVGGEDIITPGDNLVVEGIPPIPASIATTVERYTNFRSAGLNSWHPQRREILISTRFGDTNQTHLVRFPLGMRRQLTFFRERVGGASFQPTQGNYFLFTKDTGGNEFNQLYRYDLETGDVTLLTDGKSRNSGGVWSNSHPPINQPKNLVLPEHVIYTSTRRTGQDTDFYVIDPQNPSTNRLLTENQGGGWGGLAWSPDNRKFLALEYISVNESYLWMIDTQTGEKKLITPKVPNQKIFYGGAVFSRDGQGLYVITDKDAEFSRLAYINLATMEYTFLTSHINWNVEDFDLSEDGKYLAFVTNEDGASILHLLDTATRKEKPLPKLPVGQVFGIKWHRNNQDLGFTLISSQATADVYSLNINTNQVERWTESETGGINTSNFAEAQLIRWPSFDKKIISGFLYRPPAKFTGKRPVIIDIHGGPEAQSRPGFLGRNNYYLNELGIALIYPNVRGSSGYGKTFLQLDNGYKREDSVKDIGALLDWIKSQPDLDPDRVLVTGGSYGGYMSLAVAIRYSDRIRASINIVGISNFVTFLENTEGYRRDLRRVEYGDERDPKMRAFLEKISPLNNAEKITKPLFVIHGQNDPRVPVSEAEQIVRTVRNNNTPVWYLMAKDEGHGFSKKKNIDFQFYATVMFVQKYLLQ